jgi:hypothetical protein
MQASVEKPKKTKLRADFAENNRCRLYGFLPYMDTVQNRPQHKVIAKIEFWKGTMLGVMAGMAIAAFTYDIVDRSLKQTRQLNARPDQKPDWRTAAA